MYFSFPLTPDKLTAAEQLIIEYITGHRDEFLCMTIAVTPFSAPRKAK